MGLNKLREVPNSDSESIEKIVERFNRHTHDGNNSQSVSGTPDTMSNDGVGGVGVFKQKTGNNFEMKNINAGSTKITVTNDPTNTEVDIDVDESVVDHDNLTNTHNLTTDIDHDAVTNTHNLTTDIDHDTITNYAVGQHRTINDAGTAATDLWSGSKIDGLQYEWKGAWVTATAYTLNDITLSIGQGYICILAHTSGTTDDEPGVGATWTTYWELFVEGVENGNAHDHNGGDGGTIDHVNLANKGTKTHAQIDTHVGGDGSDHADVASNTTAIGLNTTHRGSDGKDHSDVITNSAKVTNATHTSEVTGATALTIADNVVDEANLKLDTGPTNDYLLTADSTKTGGMKWAAAAAGFADPMTTRGDIIYRNAANATTRLANGAADTFLSSDGTDTSWAAIPDATSSVKGIASFDEDSFNVTSGDVKPQFIGFSARLGSNTAYNSNDTLVCGTELYDIGSNYATGTGIFTAPVTGYYSFKGCARFTSPTDQQRYGLALNVNGTDVTNDLTSASGTSEISINSTKDIYCAANDLVKIVIKETHSGAITVVGSAAQYTWFSGHLISKT